MISEGKGMQATARQSQVLDELTTLEELLAGMDETISTLENMLSGVLKEPHPDTGSPTLKTAPKEELVPIAIRIFGDSSTLRRQGSRLTEIMRRLEI